VPVSLATMLQQWPQSTKKLEAQLASLASHTHREVYYYHSQSASVRVEVCLISLTALVSVHAFDITPRVTRHAPSKNDVDIKLGDIPDDSCGRFRVDVHCTGDSKLS
jgi:hypothetical protein